jgi:hypothetical protein
MCSVFTCACYTSACYRRKFSALLHVFACSVRSLFSRKQFLSYCPQCFACSTSVTKMYVTVHCKKDIVFPVPRRDVNNQTLHGR